MVHSQLTRRVVNIDEIREALSLLGPEDLASVRQAAQLAEQAQSSRAASEMQADWIARDHARAAGREDGDPWVAPESSTEAYPIGEVVQYAGERWVNLRAANLRAPSLDGGWRLETAEDISPPEYDAERAYNKADPMTWSNAQYRSLIDGNTLTPNENPGGWLRLGGVQ